MELKIMTQVDPGVLPEIQWNHEELKKEITAKSEEYKHIAYTNDQATEMKKDRAILNKLVNTFEEQRKQIKKFYLEPYEKFENQVEEVLAPVRSAISVIDEGLAEIERNYRVEKTNKMREFYNMYVGDLRMMIPFEKTINERLYKKSYTDKKVEQAYLDLFKRLRCDLESLEELPERFRDRASIEYLKNYNLSDALREGKRLEELERRMEERRKQKEETKTEALEAQNRETAETQQNATTQEDTQAIIPDPPVKESEPCTEKSEEEALFSLDFRVWGTMEQIMGLRKYMLDNGIKFGKVE